MIDQLTTFEGTLSASLHAAVNAQEVSSKTSALRDTALVVGALLVGLAIALYFAATLIRPLWTLRRRALEIADRELPLAIDRFAHATPAPDDIRPAPVEVTSTEEIGQVARAFDEVHSSAVRLAAEQAALRHSVDPVPVEPMATFVTESGLVVYVPETSELTWDAPLPSTPMANSHLRLRCPESFACGFTVDAAH